MQFRAWSVALVCCVMFVGQVHAGTPDGTSVSLASAKRVLAAGDTAGAIAAYSALIDGNLDGPRRIEALLNRAYAYQSQSRFDSAIADYNAALTGTELDKKTQATIYYNRGLARQSSGALRLAIEDFTNALFADRQLSHAYYARANALRENGNFLFAISDFEKAALYDYPQPHLVVYGEALAYIDLNRPVKAEALLQQALAMRPGFAAAEQKLSDLRSGAAAPATAVIVASDSYYGFVSQRIDAIVTNAISPVAPDQVVRKAAVPHAIRPPRHLLDAAAEVEVATMQLPGLQTLSVSRTPGYVSPAFVVSQKVKFEKVQDRLETARPEEVVVEPVSASVEYSTRTDRVRQVEEAEAKAMEQAKALEDAPPVQELSGWLVQVNSQRNEDAAWKAWRGLQAKSAALAKREAVVQKADLGNGTVVFRLRVKNLPTQKEANALCASLKSNGIACFVSRAGS